MTHKEKAPPSWSTGAGQKTVAGNDKRQSPNLQEALRYAERGWCVLPLYEPEGDGCSCRRKTECGNPGKHPRTPHGFKDASTDRAKIRRWWKRWPNAGVGIRTGPASGIVVLDVDPRNGGDKTLANLLKQYGTLPPTITADTGGGGQHYIFENPPDIDRVLGKIGDGLDVKGKGGYIVAPPSLHASGKTYRWREGHSPEDLAPAPLPGWLKNSIRKKSEKDPRRANSLIACESSRPSSPSSLSSPFSLLPSKGELEALPEAVRANIREAIRQTVPGKYGERNQAVFVFCRHLKDIPETRDSSDDLLEEIAREWHNKAYANIKTKSVDDTLGEFVVAWGRVRLGISAAVLEEIVKKTKTMQPPEWAAVFDEQTQRLILVCQELQRWHGKKPFYLAGSKAARAVGLSSQESGRLRLKVLVRKGVLKIAKRHTRTQATYYYYCPAFVGEDLNTEGGGS